MTLFASGYPPRPRGRWPLRHPEVFPRSVPARPRIARAIRPPPAWRGRPATSCKAADRRGDGRNTLRPATGKRPAAIQHSALSIQHCPCNARAVASARQPFSIQHSAFSIRNRCPHAIILRPFASLRAGRPASPASSFPDFGRSEATEGSRASSGSPRLSAQDLVGDRFPTLC